ncbi:MAG: metal-dependent hydrolase [Magnetococcales bacterium]|nr:metal-dependent hydrolase [Magnetococcales bacterium]MBF0438518.1 metal-dependent hydrolase [Magnetococcales bacterium]
MAGFNAHCAVAAVVGGMAVTTLMVSGQADPQTALICLGSCLIGGVLPDVDADESVPLKLSFTVFALLGSFFIMFSQVKVYSILELIVLWLVTFLFIKLVVFELFTRITVHRGIFHSLPAGIFFAGATAVLMSRLFHHPDKLSWLAGLFLFLGFVVHLILDELVSLNLFGVGGVSYSFGSAFKLFSRNGWVTGAMYAAVVIILFMAPNLPDVVKGVFNQTSRDAVNAHFLPTGPWFGVPFLSMMHSFH